jgi:arylsulfatase A-like enzyme
MPLLAGAQEDPREVFSQWPRASQTALRDSDWKLILKHGGQEEELYDLGRDPLETLDLADEEDEKVSELRQRIAAILEASAEIRSATDAGSEVAIPPELEEQLRALGYLGGAESVSDSKTPSQETQE